MPILPSWLRKAPQRGLGYLKDKPDKRDLRYSVTLTRPPIPPPESVDLRNGLSTILDQEASNSCVAHAFAAAIDVVETTAGLDYNPISRLFLYYAARSQHGDHKNDGGTYLRSAARALQLVGAPIETFCPFDLRRVNKQPLPEAYMQAYPRREGLYERVDGVGDMRLMNLRRALAGGHPVVFGTLVTEGFQSAAGSWRIQRPGKDERIVGGHAMCLVGYDRDGFIVVNSWGRTWRDGGTARLTQDYVAWAGSTDFWIVKNWRAVRDLLVIPRVH